MVEDKQEGGKGDDLTNMIGETSKRREKKEGRFSDKWD